MTPGSPLCLYANGTVAIGAIFTPNADDLQNHFDTPIQIEEIRFMFYVKAHAYGTLGLLSPMLRTRLRMGRIELTNEFVPTWLLGARLQASVEYANGASAGVWEYQRWLLPCPVVVPAGATLLPSFQYLLPDGTQSLRWPDNSPITVRVALVGRVLGAKPQGKIRVPYVTAFIGNTITKAQQSQDDQLVNKFTSPLHIQRFVGRIASSSSDQAYVSDDGLANSGVTALVHNLMIKSHNGDHIIGQMTNWHDVFDPVRKILPVNQILEPRGWYTVVLAEQPSLLYTPMIAMVGWREEELMP